MTLAHSQSASQNSPQTTRQRPVRSRSNTTTSFRGNTSQIAEDPDEQLYSASPSTSFNPNADLRPPPSFGARSRTNSNQNSPRRELPGFDLPVQTQPRQTISARNNNNAGTFEGPTSYQSSRDASPAPSMPRLSRVPTNDSASIAIGRSNLRPVKRLDSNSTQNDVFGDQDVDGDSRYDVDERSVSPASYGSARDNPGAAYSRSASWSVQGGYSNGNGAGSGYSNGGAYADDGGKKKMPPPPPPSRYVQISPFIQGRNRIEEMNEC